MEIQYVCSPSYFQMGDLLFDVFNTIILILIGIFSFHAYKCIKSNTGVCNKRFVLIGFSFMVLALAFAIKGFSDYNLSINTVTVHAINLINVTDMSFQSLCVIGGFIVHRVITLIALSMLFLLVVKEKTLAKLAVVALVTVNALLLAHNFVIFSATSAILLFFIGLQYWKDYKKSNINNQKLISLSFIIVAVSYLIFALLQYSSNLYIVAKLLRALGFTLLLVSFMRIFYHGKKKK